MRVLFLSSGSSTGRANNAVSAHQLARQVISVARLNRLRLKSTREQSCLKKSELVVGFFPMIFSVACSKMKINLDE